MKNIVILTLLTALIFCACESDELEYRCYKKISTDSIWYVSNSTITPCILFATETHIVDTLCLEYRPENQTLRYDEPAQFGQALLRYRIDTVYVPIY